MVAICVMVIITDLHIEKQAMSHIVTTEKLHFDLKCYVFIIHNLKLAVNRQTYFSLPAKDKE